MQNSVVYADFKVEREFKAPVSKVYQMFAELSSKELWFKAPNDIESEHTMDFRVGGSELSTGKFPDGIVHVFKANYYDIVPNQRIIYSYEMHLDDKRISVSLATIEFNENGQTTRLTLKESGVYLDELDKPSNREYGSNLLMDALAVAIKS